MNGSKSAANTDNKEQMLTKCLRTKKLRQELEAGTNSPIRPPPAPRPSRSSALSSQMLCGASIVSFREDSPCELSKLYDEEKDETYFEQCFIVLEKIGSGSFADVYKVVSLEDDRVYAIKCTREAFKSETERQERFEEVERYETLGSHRNLIRFVKSWQERNRLYIQFEYCAFSAGQLAKINHSMDECYVWQFLIELLFALKHFHDRNLVHLDVKLENILIKLPNDDRRCDLSSRSLSVETSSFSYECDQESSPSPNAGPITSSLNTSALSAEAYLRNGHGVCYDAASALEFAERLTTHQWQSNSLRVRSHSGNNESQSRFRTSTLERSRVSLGNVNAPHSHAQSVSVGADSLYDAKTPPKAGDSRGLLSDYAAFSASEFCCGCVPATMNDAELQREQIELRRRRGCAKLADCGISIDLAKPNRVLSKDPLDGDAHYLAAEVLEREQFAKPADVFALALCVLELAFDLDLPSNDAAWHFLRNEPFPINERLRAAVETTDSDVVRNVSTDLQRVLQWMLVRDPARRASVDELLADAAIRPRVSEYLAERGLSYTDVVMPLSPAGVTDNRNESKASTSSAFFDSDSAELSSTGFIATSHKLALVDGLRAISPIPRANSGSSNSRRLDNTPVCTNHRRSNNLSLSNRHFGALLADAQNGSCNSSRTSFFSMLLLCVSRIIRLQRRVRARSHAEVHQQLATLCLCNNPREPTPNKRAKLTGALATLGCAQELSPTFSAPPRRLTASTSAIRTNMHLRNSTMSAHANVSTSKIPTRLTRTSADAAGSQNSVLLSTATAKRKRENGDAAQPVVLSQRRAPLNTSTGAPSSLRRNAMRNAQLLHAASSDQRGAETDTPNDADASQVGPHGDAQMATRSIISAKNEFQLPSERNSGSGNASRKLAAAPRLSRALFTGSPTGLAVSTIRPNFVPKRLTFDEPETDCLGLQPDLSSSLSLSASSLALACRRNLSLEFEQE